MAKVNAPGQGRKKKPREVKLYQGTLNVTRDKPHPKGKVVTDIVPTPPGVTLSELGKALWLEILHQIGPLSYITDNDLRALANYCQAVEIWELAQEDIRNNGIIMDVPTRDGFIRRANPAIQVASAQYIIMKDGMTKFGLTPVDRQNMEIIPKEVEGDEWDL